MLELLYGLQPPPVFYWFVVAYIGYDAARLALNSEVASQASLSGIVVFECSYFDSRRKVANDTFSSFGLRGPTADS